MAQQLITEIASQLLLPDDFHVNLGCNVLVGTATGHRPFKLLAPGGTKRYPELGQRTRPSYAAGRQANLRSYCRGMSRWLRCGI